MKSSVIPIALLLSRSDAWAADKPVTVRLKRWWAPPIPTGATSDREALARLQPAQKIVATMRRQCAGRVLEGERSGSTNIRGRRGYKKGTMHHETTNLVATGSF